MSRIPVFRLYSFTPNQSDKSVIDFNGKIEYLSNIWGEIMHPISFSIISLFILDTIKLSIHSKYYIKAMM